MSYEVKNDKEGDIQKGFINSFKLKRRLATDHLTYQGNAIIPSSLGMDTIKHWDIDNTFNQTKISKENGEVRTSRTKRLKSPQIKENAQDLLKNATKVVGRKKKAHRCR